MNVLHAEGEKRQEHQNGFLFVPGYVVDDRQIVNILQPEDFFQLQRDHRQRIAVVALSGIENAGDAADIAEIELIVFGISRSRR